MSKPVIITIAAVLAVAGAITIGYVASTGEPPAAAPSGARSDKVKVEIKGKPRMMITLDGKKLGHTPLSFYLARSDKPITVQGAWQEQKFMRPTMKEVLQDRTTVRTIVPDRDLAIELTPPLK